MAMWSVVLEYFPDSTSECPTFVDDTAWHPLLDGEAYFARLDEMVADLGADDAVLISSLAVDSTLDFGGRRPGGFHPLRTHRQRRRGHPAAVGVLRRHPGLRAVLPQPHGRTGPRTLGAPGRRRVTGVTRFPL